MTILRKVEHGGHGAKYDLEIQNNGLGVSVECNGTRNLMRIGTGTEAAFRKLTSSRTWPTPKHLKAEAAAAGVALTGQGSFYWSPTSIGARSGMIFAARSRVEGSQAGALVFIRSVDDEGTLQLVVANAPE